MAYTYATLGGSNLPIQFSYKPPSPKKRYTIQRTGGAIVIHKAPAIVAGDSVIAWKVARATRAEWATFLNLYNDADAPELAFVGYWGDEHTVRLLDMSDTFVSAGLFDLEGVFQIVATTRYGS